ncbi:MAG: GGDEF domain-containing protein, partial [bacterium]|nr:GGDEF domain-containing protein [bacterium]
SFNFFFHPTLNPQVERMVNLSSLKIEPILKQMNRELALNARIFNLPLRDLRGFREALQKTNFELARINSLYSDTKIKLERHIQELHDIKSKLEKHVRELNILNQIICKARESLEPSQIIHNVLQGIGDGFGFPRLIWFSVDAQRGKIIPKATYGDFKVDLLNAFKESTTWEEEIGPSLAACIQDKEILHLKAGRTKGLLPSSSCLLSCLHSSELLIIPISTDRKVTDLLLIDNQNEPVTISADTIKVFDILAVNLGMALENAKLFQYISQMAVVDCLTNIYNRRQLESSLSNEISRANRFQQSFSIALFDVDHFKTVNDTYGHQVGDLILKDVAAIIKSNSRSIDTVGRLGGDEFMVILPNTKMESAFAFAERVRHIVEEYGVLRKKIFPKCQITLSIGLAEFNNFQDTPEDLLYKADMALYRSKQKGRNTVSAFQG